MSQPLVLSLFPGAGLFDMAFEAEGFCVVDARDRLMGGDHRTFTPPPRRFDGVIGGPPCKRWSRLAAMVVNNGYELAPDLIPEFCRIVAAAAPAWFVMENVEGAPLPSVDGYVVRDELVRDVWVGGETSRLRRFSFGTRDGLRLRVETLALHRPAPEHAVMASGGGRPVPVALGGNGKPKRTNPMKNLGYCNSDNLATALRCAGLPSNYFDEIERDVRHKPWTVAGKQSLIGNGVPLALGRAVAKAVKRAMYPDLVEAAS